MKLKVKVDGKEYEVEVEDLGVNRYRVTVEGKVFEVSIESEKPSAIPIPSPTPSVKPATPTPIPTPSTPAPAIGGNVISAPISGKVLKVLVKPGDTVDPKSVVITLESMKMELEVYAGRSGRIKEVLVKPGDSVRTGQPIAVLE